MAERRSAGGLPAYGTRCRPGGSVDCGAFVRVRHGGPPAVTRSFAPAMVARRPSRVRLLCLGLSVVQTLRYRSSLAKDYGSAGGGVSKAPEYESQKEDWSIVIQQ
ncbi:hypothetical protein Y032_0344g3078 [Ancylostoma ceylanicum]|nr:hypothetical protein Y032_0344g3078 [Ancylostoma ceylanicum]